MRKLFLFAALIGLSACASNPDKMTASYVSPITYQNHSCTQLSAEAQRVHRRTSDLYGTLDKESSNDTAQMAVGLVLFWPALFFLEGGDGPQAAEYKRLKGEYDAIEQTSITKNCGIEFKQAAPEPTTNNQEAEKTLND